MNTKRLLLMATAILLAHLSFASAASAQFQSGRLRELSSRLATEANSFAEASYRGSSGLFRDNRNDVQAAMLAHHFNGGARLFNRMVNDRLRRSDLRNAFQVLQSLATPIDSNNVQSGRWSTIQRLMTDISAELNVGDSRDPRDDPREDGQYYPGGSGRMSWRGRVDDDVRIVIRGGTATVETIGGTPYYDASTNFTASLPRRRVNVTLTVRRARGDVIVEQQPSRENDFTAVVRIRDPRGGAFDYEFELTW